MNDRGQDNKEKEEKAADKFKQWQAAVWALLSKTRVLFWWGQTYLEYFDTARAQKTPADFLVKMRAFRERPWYVKLGDWLGSPLATLRRNRVYAVFTSLFVVNKYLLAGKKEEADSFTYHADSFSPDEINDWAQAPLEPGNVPSFFAPQISALAVMRGELQHAPAQTSAAVKASDVSSVSDSDVDAQTEDMAAEISANTSSTTSTSTASSTTADVARTLAESKSDEPSPSDAPVTPSHLSDNKDVPEEPFDALFKKRFTCFVKAAFLFQLDWKTTSCEMVENAMLECGRQFNQYTELVGASTSSADVQSDEKTTITVQDVEAAHEILYKLHKEFESLNLLKDDNFYPNYAMKEVDQLYCPLTGDVVFLKKKKIRPSDSKALYEIATHPSQAPILIQQDEKTYQIFGRNSDGTWSLTPIEDKEGATVEFLQSGFRFPTKDNEPERREMAVFYEDKRLILINLIAPYHHATRDKAHLLAQAWLERTADEFLLADQTIRQTRQTLQTTLSAVQYELQHTQAIAISRTLQRDKRSQAAQSANVDGIPDVVFDHYCVSLFRLGIDPALQCVTPELIRKAMREKALEWHPDRYDPPGRRAADEPSLLASFQALVDRRTSNPTLCSPTQLEGNQCFLRLYQAHQNLMLGQEAKYGNGENIEARPMLPHVLKILDDYPQLSTPAMQDYFYARNVEHGENSKHHTKNLVDYFAPAFSDILSYMRNAVQWDKEATEFRRMMEQINQLMDERHIVAERLGDDDVPPEEREQLKEKLAEFRERTGIIKNQFKRLLTEAKETPSVAAHPNALFTANGTTATPTASVAPATQNATGSSSSATISISPSPSPATDSDSSS